MKEAELIALQPQSKRNDQGEQHECLGCFKDRSNLTLSVSLLFTEGNSFKEMIRASKEEYEQLPPYMKSLATWEV